MGNRSYGSRGICLDDGRKRDIGLDLSVGIGVAVRGRLSSDMRGGGPFRGAEVPIHRHRRPGSSPPLRICSDLLVGFNLADAESARQRMSVFFFRTGCPVSGDGRRIPARVPEGRSHAFRDTPSVTCR